MCLKTKEESPPVTVYSSSTRVRTWRHGRSHGKQKSHDRNYAEALFPDFFPTSFVLDPDTHSEL